jgi:hypothetical protein
MMIPAFSAPGSLEGTLKGDARDEAILEVLTGLYNAAEVRCAEGQLRISPILNTDDVRLCGRTHSVRFNEHQLVELIDQSRVPVSEELVRVLLCLIYHEHARYPWVTKERAERVV